MLDDRNLDPPCAEDDPIYDCAECDGGIYEGEGFLDLFCGKICERCMQDRKQVA